MLPRLGYCLVIRTVCIVLNGEHNGKTLNDVLDIWGRTALGKNAERFFVKLLILKEAMDIYSADSFVFLIVFNGNAIIMWNDEEINIKKGDSIFISANFKAELKGKAEILHSHI